MLRACCARRIRPHHAIIEVNCAPALGDLFVPLRTWDIEDMWRASRLAYQLYSLDLHIAVECQSARAVQASMRQPMLHLERMHRTAHSRVMPTHRGQVIQ